VLNLIVVAALFVGGAGIILQGLRAVQGKRRFRQDPLSRLILASLSGEQEDTLMKILGVLRIAMGVFFVGLGFYLAWTIL
jgi:hypothetical protein